VKRGCRVAELDSWDTIYYADIVRRAAVTLMLLSVVACEGQATKPSDPRYIPPYVPPDIVMDVAAAPNPAHAGDAVTIQATVTVTDGSPFYWNSNFYPFGGPANVVPPGTLSARMGGPIPSGTPVTITYQTSAQTVAVLIMLVAPHPIEDVHANPTPKDTVSKDVIMHVQ